MENLGLSSPSRLSSLRMRRSRALLLLLPQPRLSPGKPDLMRALTQVFFQQHSSPARDSHGRRSLRPLLPRSRLSTGKPHLRLSSPSASAHAFFKQHPSPARDSHGHGSQPGLDEIWAWPPASTKLILETN